MKKFSKPVAIEQESNAGQYCIKPEIIEKIERSPDCDDYYSEISDMVKKCVKFIDDKNYAAAREEYIETIASLKIRLIK